MNDGFWRQKLGASAVGLMVFVVLTQAKVVYALEPKAQDVRKLDDCVVGAWRQTSNDQAEVMSELFPGMPVTRVETSNVIFKFNPDGTYASDRVHIETSTISQSSDRPRRVDDEGNFQAAGRWSAQGGFLIMHPDLEAADLKLNIDGHPFPITHGKEVSEQAQRKVREWQQKVMRERPTGKEIKAAALEGQELQSEAINTLQDNKKTSQKFRYTCEKNSRLETKMTFPGWSKPVTAIFSPAN